MKRKICGLILVFIFLGACRSSHVFYLKPGSFIRYGCGGGFTGETITYQVNGDGQFFKTSSLAPDTLRYKPITQDKMQELESILRNDSLMASVQEDFGNMTCFIEIYKQGKLVKRFSWPEGNGPDNKVVDRLNKVLGSLEKTPEN